MNSTRLVMNKKRLLQTSLDSFIKTGASKYAKMSSERPGEQLTKEDTTDVVEITKGTDKPESKTAEFVTSSPDFDGSNPLFDDDNPGSSSSTSSAVAPAVIKKQNSLGPDLSTFLTTPGCSGHLEKIKATNNRTVLITYKTAIPGRDTPPLPYPEIFLDKWDPNFVRFPCSKDNLYPTKCDGEEKVVNRWELIQNALCRTFATSFEVEDAVFSYNGRYANSWNFRAFHKLLNEIYPKDQCETLLNVVLPEVVKLTLQLPEICTQSIPLLKQDQNHTIVMSQKQCACLLANAFFCTYPRRNVDGRRKTEYCNYPRINFSRIFGGGKINVEKLKCILHYFERVTEKMPTGVVSFQRQSLENFPEWAQSKTPLSKLHISKKGTIEDFGDGMLQVDFANKFVGGGVIGDGCVQEEIRFLICPEFMVSMLFTEVLLPNECLIMTGCERYSCYMGYADSFEYSADFRDETPRDAWGRRQIELVAIDAKPYYRKAHEQFSPDDVIRELNKAYCGFVRIGENVQHLSAVATGNWGCGAFGGDKEIKSLIQLMSAAEACRDVVYFTFDDEKFMKDLYEVYCNLQKRQTTVGQLFNEIKAYYNAVVVSDSTCRNEGGLLTLFEYLVR